MSTLSFFLLLELDQLIKVPLIFQTCALTNYTYQAKGISRISKMLQQKKLTESRQKICVYFNFFIIILTDRTCLTRSRLF